MSQELQRIEPADLPVLSTQQVKARLTAILDLMRSAMVENIDFGKIPGTGGKPTLLKPGAEKLCVMFQLDAQYETVRTTHDTGHMTVVSKCIVYHAPSGNRLGSATAICSTMESKYAYRHASRLCPACGKPAIIKGKEEYGGGWLCWKKKDGCDAKFKDHDPAIVNQQVGRIPNEDLPDTFNTVIRIAEKRALVAAVRLVTGASAIFEEGETETPKEPGVPAEQPKPAKAMTRQQANEIRAAIAMLKAQPGYEEFKARELGRFCKDFAAMTEADALELLKVLHAEQAKRNAANGKPPDGKATLQDGLGDQPASEAQKADLDRLGDLLGYHHDRRDALIGMISRENPYELTHAGAVKVIEAWEAEICRREEKEMAGAT